MSGDAKSGKKAPACPICGKGAAEPYSPFCSARCKQIDLNRWLSEVYAVPDNEPPANCDDTEEGG